MTLLYRCDNDLCRRTAEPYIGKAPRVGRPDLPTSDDWRDTPYGDFCCEDCEREITDEEQRKERERAGNVARGGGR